MARISGMVLGLGLLVVISSLSSPVSAWDSDDDDNHYKSRGRFGGPVFPQPILAPPQFVDRYDLYQGNYGVPQYQPTPAAPLAPAPLPPYSPRGNSYSHLSEPVLPSPAPPETVLSQNNPGQFTTYEVPLYPFVRVKDADDIPRCAVPQIVAVRSPDPLRFPGCVYVQVFVPPGPCREVKVKDGGAKIELKYPDFEVEIASGKGVVVVDYDD